jgi:rhamnose utilization protein RhaD (predicted bifunctional aldolase and dehydrogenase)
MPPTAPRFSPSKESEVSDLDALARYSADIGRDIEQVQAAGGNTSLKENGTLWVKASGLWLADAEERDLFVPVDVAKVLDAIDGGSEDDVKAATLHDQHPAGLRPSIETSLHALLPHRFVIHTHSVRTIAIAIRADAEAEFERRLDGLSWAWVPYTFPGLPLTRAIEQAIGTRPIDIVVMGNHGLVVAGDDLEATAALLREVERRLDAPVRSLEARAAPPRPGLRPVKHGTAHAIADDTAMRALATAGSYYPDHVIFLGPAACTPESREPGQKLVLEPGAGAYVLNEAPAAADELALCLALVLARVPDDAELVRFTPAQETALLGWNAEQYRQSLTRGQMST